MRFLPPRFSPPRGCSSCARHSLVFVSAAWVSTLAFCLSLSVKQGLRWEVFLLLIKSQDNLFLASYSKYYSTTKGNHQGLKQWEGWEGKGSLYILAHPLQNWQHYASINSPVGQSFHFLPILAMAELLGTHPSSTQNKNPLLTLTETKTSQPQLLARYPLAPGGSPSWRSNTLGHTHTQLRLSFSHRIRVLVSFCKGRQTNFSVFLCLLLPAVRDL